MRSRPMSSKIMTRYSDGVPSTTTIIKTMCIRCESITRVLRSIINNQEYHSDRHAIVEDILNATKFCPDTRPARVIYPGYFIKK